MVNRAIEGFRADQGANHKVLHPALQDHVKRKVIDVRLLEWTDSQHELGNIGAQTQGGLEVYPLVRPSVAQNIRLRLPVRAASERLSKDR